MKLPWILPVTILIASCSKNGSSKDTELPVVVIHSPSPGQVVTGGQPLTISATLTDNRKLSEVHVHISNTATGNLLVDIHRTPSSGSYNLQEQFTPHPGTSYRIQVITKDNSANEGRATVEVSAN